MSCCKALRTAPLWLLALTLAACGASTTRLAPRVTLPSPLTPPAILPFPPPAAPVETLPAAPSDPSCVWQDGSYVFEGENFSWQPGAWVRPPPDCALAGPTYSFQPSPLVPQGVVHYYAPVWVRLAPPAAPQLCSPPPPCDAPPPSVAKKP